MLRQVFIAPVIFPMSLQTISPVSGERLRTYPQMETAEILSALAATQDAFELWRKRSVTERAALLPKLAKILKAEKEALGAIITREMGKPVAQAVAEIEKSAWLCEYYAQNGAAFLHDESVEAGLAESFVTYQPLGVILIVMPWNYPFWQVFRAAVPALLAGNAVVLKHASNVPECAQKIESLFRRAGFPESVFRNLQISAKQVATVVESPLVQGVALTGSERAGKEVAALAGRHLKKTVLELGGSDPYLILADADIGLAARTCVDSRMMNNGQSCIAAKRFIVVESVRAAFEQAVVRHMQGYVMGDPMQMQTRLGPLARVDLRDQLHEQVTACVSAGATLLLGGEVPRRAGAWYPPTVLADVRPGMPAYSEELFGPVAAIIAVADQQVALQVANDTRFGLGGAVFTANVQAGRRLAREAIHSGSVAVNGMVRSDPRLPFGGIASSGYGRELAGFGIREFVNVKTVMIR